MIYEASKNIIKAIENEVSTTPVSPFRIIMFLKREAIYPVLFIIKGFHIWYRDFSKFSILALILVSFFTWTYSKMLQNDAIFLFPFLLWLSFFIASVISMFSAPSSYSFCGVTAQYTNAAITSLQNSNIHNLQQIELIKENIFVFENRVKVRVISLRGFLALCWTLTFYLYMETVKLTKTSKVTVSHSDIETIIIGFFGIFILYICIECYAKINTLIFRSALFGCNEYINLYSNNE